MYLNSIFKSLSRFSYIKKNFSYENLQDVEIITRDYWGSLRNILKSFSNHKINLTDIEPLKLSRTHKGQNIVVKLTFEKVEDKKYNELIYDLQQRYDQVLINNDMSVWQLYYLILLYLQSHGRVQNIYIIDFKQQWFLMPNTNSYLI